MNVDREKRCPFGLPLHLNETTMSEFLEHALQGREGNVGQMSEVFDSERLFKVRLDPGDRLSRSLALISSCCDRPEPSRFWPLQYSVNDFTLNQPA